MGWASALQCFGGEQTVNRQTEALQLETALVILACGNPPDAIGGSVLDALRQPKVAFP